MVFIGDKFDGFEGYISGFSLLSETFPFLHVYFKELIFLVTCRMHRDFYI